MTKPNFVQRFQLSHSITIKHDRDCRSVLPLVSAEELPKAEECIQAL